VSKLLREIAGALRAAAGRLRDRRGQWLRWPDAQADARRVAGVLGVVTAANVLLFLFVTEPLYRVCQAKVAEWEATGQRLEQRRRGVERLEEQVQRLERQRQNLQQFYDVILADKVAKMTAIQREIRSIASQFQVDPETVTYDPSYLQAEELVRFDISFPLRGSYENLRQFIQRVESSTHFLIIDDVSLADAREGGVSLGLNVHLHTFFKDREFRPEKGRRS
jgi:Tfp pilus assembly protein PilO